MKIIIRMKPFDLNHKDDTPYEILVENNGREEVIKESCVPKNDLFSWLSFMGWVEDLRMTMDCRCVIEFVK